jgi:UDP-N-acetylmuramate dehydrogenase
MLMQRLERTEIHAKLGMRLKVGELLAPHTTFRIGGPADLFVRAESRDELVEFATAASAARLPLFVLGNGSNILVSDAGVRGLVVENHADGFVIEEDKNKLRLTADSGASLPGLANRLARQGWSGLEWAIGIPSTVGAAVVGNAGAHGSSISTCLIRAEVHRANGDIEWLLTSNLDFAYRSSRLKHSMHQEIVLRAEFELERDDLTACLARMNKYSEHRRRTQPTNPSIGSMFKNPPGDYAGRLIETAGLKRARVGQVQVSPVHANFFVNLGGGTAREVLELVGLVRQKVREASGVELELEIQLVGDWGSEKVAFDDRNRVS